MHEADRVHADRVAGGHRNHRAAGECADTNVFRKNTGTVSGDGKPEDWGILDPPMLRTEFIEDDMGKARECLPGGQSHPIPDEASVCEDCPESGQIPADGFGPEGALGQASTCCRPADGPADGPADLIGPPLPPELLLQCERQCTVRSVCIGLLIVGALVIAATVSIVLDDTEPFVITGSVAVVAVAGLKVIGIYRQADRKPGQDE